MIRTISTALAAALLADVLTGAAPDLPASLTIALSLAVPDNEGAGLARPSGGGYADVTVARAATAWTLTGRRMANTGDVVFPTPTASWGTVRAYAVLAGTTFLFAEQLQAARTITAGAGVRFPAGTIGLAA